MSRPPPEGSPAAEREPLVPFSDERAFLQLVLDSSTEYSIIAADLDGNILLWNAGARRIYGYS
jgi:PAS domain-containing protein